MLRGQYGRGFLRLPPQPERAGYFVEPDQGRAKQFRQFARGEAAEQFQLEQALLRHGVAKREIGVLLVFGENVGHPPFIPEHPHGAFQ